MNINSIEVDELMFSFDPIEPVLKNISLDINKGKFYSILGPNGSGKTTLLKVLAKLLNTPDQKVFIDSQDINLIKSKALARCLAVVPQQTSVEFDFTTRDIVMMGRAPYISRFSSETNEDAAIVKNAMQITSTWELRNKNINTISGGERQRVIIARAIAQQTEIILMDEPISHLDIHHQIELLNQLKKINIRDGKTIVAVLHDLNLAAAFSDRIILMNNGHIHAIGSPEQVLNTENMEQVFGIRATIINEPHRGRIHIIPMI